MDKTKDLPDVLLVKILSFLPTKVAVSTSVLSKRWESLWMQVPILDCDCSRPALWYFVEKNLPLLAPFIEILSLKFICATFQLDEGIKLCVEVLHFPCLRELSICYVSPDEDGPNLSVPTNLYTCKLLETLKLEGDILVDLPQMVCLPSLKNLQLKGVTYLNEGTLQQLLSSCPVLEDLVIKRSGDENVKTVVVIIVSSLLRLSLEIGGYNSCDEYVISTPSLKYFKVLDARESTPYSFENMPNLEEAHIYISKNVEKLLAEIANVKRLTLEPFMRIEYEVACRTGIVFNQLEHLSIVLYTTRVNWSKLLVWLLQRSPNLKVLKIKIINMGRLLKLEPDVLEGSAVPKCLLESLETFELDGYMGRPEERDFLSFIFKNACCLKFSSIVGQDRSHITMSAYLICHPDNVIFFHRL